MIMTQSIGKVYLIGAGPGDPGLITVKGLECVKKADVIIYDYLANERLLEHRRPDAELIYVGKQGSRHTLPQEEINASSSRRQKKGRSSRGSRAATLSSSAGEEKRPRSLSITTSLSRSCPA